MRTIAAALVLLISPAFADTKLTVDCSKETGTLRPLHGGNGGVLSDGGLTNLSAYFREIQMPLVRLHDCHWPNPDVVDMHVVFPNPAADPADPKSFDFRKTDQYIAAIRATGAKIVYRLGESIEHTPTKYHVHPPADPRKWAAACVQIVRHYKDSVAYWEIWNEPENRPAMWTGTDEQFLELYEITAKAIKKEFPQAKVGGPSLGYTGKITDGNFQPSPFLSKFLERCKSQNLPLDFFSWHLYTDDPSECVLRARGIRQTLDRFNFTQTESHFNEWNYLPNNDWRPMMQAGQGEPRRKFNEQLASPAAAAFVASVLINLQHAPVDQANIFRADNGGFGLFSSDAIPNKPFFAFKAFNMLLQTPLMLQTTGGNPREVSICAATNQSKTKVSILLSNYKSPEAQIELVVQPPWTGPTKSELFQLDASHNLTPINHSSNTTTFTFDAKSPFVCLLKLQQDK